MQDRVVGFGALVPRILELDKCWLVFLGGGISLLV